MVPEFPQWHALHLFLGNSKIIKFSQTSFFHLHVDSCIISRPDDRTQELHNSVKLHNDAKLFKKAFYMYFSICAKLSLTNRFHVSMLP